LRAGPLDPQPDRSAPDLRGGHAAIDRPAGHTPSPRLLADKAAEVLAGMAYALDGLALFVDDPLGLSRAAWRRSTARARLAARLWLMPDVQSRHLDGLLTQCTGDNALVIAALTQDRRNRMAQAIGVSPRCSRAARLPV
jgi:hypothetical protein